MRKYKVIQIALAVKNNRVANFGEFVDESELTVNPNELVKSGALELVESEEEVTVEQTETETETETETDADADADASEEKVVTAKDKAKAKLTGK